MLFTAFTLFMPKSESLPSLFTPSLFFKEGRQRFTLIALYKRATLSESLFRSQETSDSLEKPQVEFPTMPCTRQKCFLISLKREGVLELSSQVCSELSTCLPSFCKEIADVFGKLWLPSTSANSSDGCGVLSNQAANIIKNILGKTSQFHHKISL